MNNWTKGKQTRVLILVGLVLALTASFVSRVGNPTVGARRSTGTL